MQALDREGIAQDLGRLNRAEEGARKDGIGHKKQAQPKGSLAHLRFTLGSKRPETVIRPGGTALPGDCVTDETELHGDYPSMRS